MANEISYSGQAGLSGVYAVMRNIAGQVYNRSTNAFENWVTANLANYKITLTENGDGGGDYLADFDPDTDGIAAGRYKVEVFNSSDNKIGTGWIRWSGTGEVTAEKLLANKAIQTKLTGKVDYYDDDGETILLSHMPTDASTDITRTPS